MRIVPMQAHHVPALVALENACFSTPWTAAGFTEELDNPLAVFLVAEKDGDVLGYLGFLAVLDEADITNVAVSPSHRRQGVAAALVTAAQDACRARGIRRLGLEVRESNEAAIRLYERFGFVRDGKRPRFYSAPVEDALLYSWINQNLPPQEGTV